ncbi:CWF19-like protein 2 isoform X2 [Triplophysa dalaica]|uniref:CWF19-like protein 2 isoform X2 n=1 Tax=Triplophysa dalaica TaxID=1582913 RepID=UPI0024DF431F|nr:CWF19-like protein 2 isoform X2 [Triplophysa dalaica]
MAAYGMSFESVNSIKSRKEDKREAREEILQRAKQKFEDEERRRAERKARGEDTWMLPEIDNRLQEIGQEHTVKNKKKKKEKKAKKSKKEKKKKVKKEKREQEDGSSDSSQDSEDEWVEGSTQSGGGEKPWKVEQEATPSSSASTNQRDDWMTFDFLAMKTTSVTERRAQKEAVKEAERNKALAIEQAGLHRLELNPYWKDGGRGLPPGDAAGTVVKRAGVVNDGGVSWLQKSYQRMNEQAEREKRSVQSVVAERYGSMEEFQKRLDEAEEAAYGERREDMRYRHEGRERWRRDDVRERWRRGDQEDRWRERSPQTERDRDRSRDDREQKRERYDGQRGDREPHSVKCISHSDSSASLSSLRSKFLKPSDNEEHMSVGAGLKRGGATSSMSNQSAGFRKPVDDDGSGVVAAWRKSSSVQEKVASQKRTDQRTALLEESNTTIAAESSSESEEEEEEVILTEEEMNKLGAKLVKAEIMGNTAQVEKLKAQMDAARQAKERKAQRKERMEQVSSQPDAEKEVVLFRTDQSGRAWPVNTPTQHQEPRGGRRKKKAIETHQDGERVRYFEDDDGVDLREMVRREKMSTAEDQNALYSRMAGKMMGRTDGDNYMLDDMFVSSAAQKEHSGRDEERQRNKAVHETRRLAGRMEKCPHCFDSPELPKHLIVAVGTKVYMCLPNGVSLTEGHCLIVPVQHHTAATGLDEDIWNEIQTFRRTLVRMFEAQDLDCVFFETHMNLKRHFHMVYECVPLPKELGDMAPIFFKKAIMESDEEWAMNKKVVDLSSKDIRRAVPRGLPYFSVDFGLQGGFAHVIENEKKFPHYFGKEILGGMLDLEPRRWRKPIRENFDDQRKKVLAFAQWWKPFDCTKTDS